MLQNHEPLAAFSNSRTCTSIGRADDLVGGHMRSSFYKIFDGQQAPQNRNNVVFHANDELRSRGSRVAPPPAHEHPMSWRNKEAGRKTEDGLLAKTDAWPPRQTAGNANSTNQQDAQAAANGSSFATSWRGPCPAPLTSSVLPTDEALEKAILELSLGGLSLIHVNRLLR